MFGPEWGLEVIGLKHPLRDMTSVKEILAAPRDV